MVIAMYLRKSRSDDRDEPIEITLERHRKILDEYAQKQHYAIKKVYQEVVSGESIVGRPQMMQMLDDVEHGEYDAVLCMDIDRLGRGGMKDQGIIIETFKYAETLIITPEKTYDLQNEFDEQTTEFKTFLSRQEYKIINKRLRRGVIQTVKDGGYIANAPFGYQKAIIDKRPSLEIVPEEAEYIRMMFDMYVNQHVGSHIISERLNQLGIIPRRNAEWSRSTVRRILKNPVYIGKIAWNRVTRKKTPKGKVVATHHSQEEWLMADGLHEPIISQEIWDNAQEIRTRNKLPPYNTGSCKSSLAGLVICGNCGSKMQLQPCHGRWYYIRCTRKGCCGSASFEEVESTILKHLNQSLTNIRLEQNLPRDTSLIDSKITAAECEGRQLAEQRSRLMSLLEQGIYTVEEYQERMGLIASRITANQLQLSELFANRENIVGLDSAALADKIQTVLDRYQKSDIPTKNALLKSVISSVDYYRESGRNQSFTLNLHLCTNNI